MIQWRNFNIDPDWYLGRIGFYETGEILGVKQLMQLIHEEFPHLKFGYFNPPIERIKGNYQVDFAHQLTVDGKRKTLRFSSHLSSVSRHPPPTAVWIIQIFGFKFIL